jgi:hypothetical protein
MSGFSGTRRDVLRRGAAAVGAATVAGNAGCMGLLGSGGGYAQWVPEPGTIRDRDHYHVSAFDFTSLVEHEDELPDEGWNFDSVEDIWAPADVDWEAVELYLRFGEVTIVAADFERSEVVESFEDEDYGAEAEYEGYTTMLGPDERRVAGVGGSALVLAGRAYGDFEDPEDVFETVIDTKNGDEGRYVDEDEHFGELAQRLGEGDIVDGYGHEPTETNQVAVGHRYDVMGADTDAKKVLVFEGDEFMGHVEDWFEGEKDDGAYDAWEDVELARNGQSAVITGTVPTDEISR